MKSDDIDRMVGEITTNKMRENERIRELAIQSGLIAPYGSDHEGLRDFDYRKFTELVREDEREACAKVCEAMDHDGVMIAADCAKAIRAMGDAIDISQECVDETAKDRHEDIYDIWVEHGTRQQNRQVAPSGFECPRCGHCCKPDWVGLTDDEVEAIYDQEGHADVVLLTQAKLKEKNAS